MERPTTIHRNGDTKIAHGLWGRAHLGPILYPGVVQLIERMVWDHEAESLSLSTRTRIMR